MNMKLLGLATFVTCAAGAGMAEEGRDRFVRVAELEIDPAQADAFATAIREVGQASVRSEDGCLALYAVAEKQDPGRVRVFEIYRDPAAYAAHRLTPHFRRFRAATDAMVKSRRLIDATPISLASRGPTWKLTNRHSTSGDDQVAGRVLAHNPVRSRTGGGREGR